MNQLPLLSIIVPVYKVEAYLDKCLASLTAQTYGNLEILLVEDGSPDGSGAICDAWAERDSRIKVIHQENQGGGAARNAALEIARGELLAFVDSDDYVHPELYTHLYSLLQQGADIAECGYVDTFDNEAVLGGGSREPVFYSRQEAMALHIRDEHFRQIIWNKLYRRPVAEGIRFPVGTKIDDEYFTWQLLAKAERLVCSEFVGYAYRQQPDSIMHGRFSVKRVQSLDAKKQRLAYLKERLPQLENLAKEDLVMTCLFVMQESLRSLKGEELREAKNLIRETMVQTEGLVIGPEQSRMRQILLCLAQGNLTVAAKLLNFLIKIHVLT
ncbi:MAG: glycosyltransferase [Oscillospiraceae bacterium]|nr:glycosyltransferase [Oscillospiraceae bacterium]